MRCMPLLMSGAAIDAASGALPAEAADLPAVLEDYYRVMAIAHFIRRGGVKSMIYRVETGKTEFVPVDYYDEAHEQLAARYRKLIHRESAAAVHSLLQELRDITEEEERTVSEFLPQLDALLLSDRRRQAVAIDEHRAG